jgi:proton-dependent oligopeptide transporter, POT family
MASDIQPSGGIDLPHPYLLFLGDTTEGAYARTAFGLRDWAPERRIGEWSCANAFQSLNPLLVFLMTPLLLAHWRPRAERGTEPSATRKMALGAFIVALAYSLLAIVSAAVDPERANWLWLVLFFVIFTLGELYILPTGLGLFARLAPTHLAATTVAAWFLAIFTGSLAAGAVGTLWSSAPHAEFFVILALLALAAAGMLLTMDRATCRLEAARTNDSAATKLAQAPGR